ncbi:MAG: DUF4982 domain-containing protein, partial [Clostridia bacterium]
DLPPNSIEEIREAIKQVPEDPYEIAKTANDLATWTKELDKSRVVVSNCVVPSLSYEIGYTDALDVVGFSHRGPMYKHFHDNYPQKAIQGSETGGNWFDYHYMLDKDYVAGVFIWTGVAYMGEATRSDYLRRGNAGSMLDFAAFKRANYYATKAWWSQEPSVYLATAPASTCLFKNDENGVPVEKVPGEMWVKRANKAHMLETWNYEEGEEIYIESFTNCDEVTLYVNGKEQRTVTVSDCVDKAGKWIIPFEAGEIKAIAKKGDETIEFAIKTANDFAKIDIISDKKELSTDYDSAAHIEVIVTDENGTRLPNNEQKVKFELEGAYINMGVDNGSSENFQTYQNDEIITSKGRAMLILQGKETGTIKVKAIVGDISSETIEITVK